MADLAPGVVDRAVGALLGLAIGDAIGTTLEFSARDSHPPLTDMIGGGPFALAPGIWTDDTSMALALGDSLTGRSELDPDDLMRRFVGWWRAGDYSPTGTCFDIGITTREALARFERTANPFAGSVDPATAGNGSLMRIAPVAIWGLAAGDAALRRTAREQSRTTHAAPVCLDACEAWATILLAAIRGAGYADAVSAATAVATEPIAAILAGSWRGKPRWCIASTGYVAHSLEAALWCVDQTDAYAEAVLLAANLGNDSDTTAAITGQLAGALYGAAGIPLRWRQRVAWRERIEAIAGALLDPRSAQKSIAIPLSSQSP